MALNTTIRLPRVADNRVNRPGAAALVHCDRPAEGCVHTPHVADEAVDRVHPMPPARGAFAFESDGSARFSRQSASMDPSSPV